MSIAPSRWHLPIPGLAAVVLCAALASACAAPMAARVKVSTPSSRLAGIAVTEIELSGGGEPFEPFKRTLDVLDVLWRESSWTVLDPREFRVLRPDGLDDPGPLTATDLVVRAQSLRIDPLRLSLLTMRVGIREKLGRADVSKGQEHGVGHDFKSEVAVSLILRDMHGGHVAEIDIVRGIDPFAERPDYDARPALRAAVREITELLIRRCGHCFVDGYRPGFALHQSPASVLDATDGGVSLRQRLTTAGPLEHDQLLWSNMQYVDPALDLPAAQGHLATPSAACVGQPAAPGLAPGDCIIAIDGAPAVGVHAVGHALERGATRLTVVGSDGARRDVAFP